MWLGLAVGCYTRICPSEETQSLLGSQPSHLRNSDILDGLFR